MEVAGRKVAGVGPRAHKSTEISAQTLITFTFRKRETFQSPTDGHLVFASLSSGVDYSLSQKGCTLRQRHVKTLKMFTYVFFGYKKIVLY